jgi:ribonuclease Z
VRVTILGTGTATPSLHRSSPSYLVSTAGATILVDVGPSVVRRLLETGHGVNDVDVIVLTHFHPDNPGDLAAFLFAANYGVERRRRDLILVGGRGVRLFFRRLARVYPWIVPTLYRLTVRALPHGTMRAGAVRITTTPMRHKDESIGVGIEEGTGGRLLRRHRFDARFSDPRSRADLLVAECSFPERKLEGHLNLAALLPWCERPRRARSSLRTSILNGRSFAARCPAAFARRGRDGAIAVTAGPSPGGRLEHHIAGVDVVDPDPACGRVEHARVLP